MFDRLIQEMSASYDYDPDAYGFWIDRVGNIFDVDDYMGHENFALEYISEIPTDEDIIDATAYLLDTEGFMRLTRDAKDGILYWEVGRSPSRQQVSQMKNLAIELGVDAEQDRPRFRPGRLF